MSRTSTNTSARFALTGPDGRIAAWQLHVLVTPDPARLGTAIPICMGTTLWGRDPSAADGAQLSQFADLLMSRNHLSVLASPGARHLELTDLGSSNGSWLNGTRIGGSAPARHGSVLRFGATVCVVEGSAGRWQEFDRPTAGMPGASLEARRMRAEVYAAAQTAKPCVVVGPAGTGRERACGELHTVSRRLGKLVRIDLKAIDPTALEAELFGLVRHGIGSAPAVVHGRVRDAEGGTLVLDDIADLPMEFQPKLLRLLETGRYRPVGAEVDAIALVKVVAGTAANLDALAVAGRFLPELGQKLRSHSVRMVPMARRAADWVGLANAAAAPAGAASWSAVLSPIAVEVLALYGWPDNLYELAQVLQQLRALPPPVPVKALPAALVEAVRGRTVRSPVQLHQPEGDATQPTPTAAELRRLLDQFGGDVDAMAKALGRERKHVNHWLAMAGIQLPGATIR